MKALRFLMPLILLAFVSCGEKGKTGYTKIFDDQIVYCKTVKELNNALLENNFPPMIASRVYVYSIIAA